MSKLQARQFILARPKGSVVFKTRNVGCDLAGPVTPEGIRNMYAKGELELPVLEETDDKVGPFKVISGGQE